MRNIVIAYVDRFLHDRRERLRFGGVVLLLAVIVVGVVFWRLSMTGIAMTNEVNCGLEEHQHDNSCYTEVLTCGLEESAGSEGHTHDSTCYETVTELVCGLEESEGHIHDDSCFDEYGNLTCAIPESEGHAHTDACYETTQVLICGLEEEPATAGHTHDSSCYELVLTCTIPEHVHTIECMTDETADVETAEDWEATLPEDDELTGLWNEDVIAVAQSQLGYTESEANFRLAEDGETRQGYTRYGAWYGNEYGDWDGMFAAFCLEYAGVEDMPVSAGAYAWVVALEYEGLYADAEEYAPNPGELIFLNTDDDDKADTVAIVTGVDEEKGELTVIQGDSNDAVEEYTLNSNDDSIVGYGILPEQPEEEIAGTGDEDLPSAPEEDAAAAAGEPAGELEEVDVRDASAEPAEEEEEAAASGEASEEAEEELTALIFEGEDYIVTVSFGPEAGVPESAELIVREYASDSEEYLARLEEAAELYGWGEEELPEGVRLFNIGLYVTDEETGESVEIEPDEPVEVVITYLDQEEENSYAVTHFGDEKPEELETVAEYEDGVQTVAFDLDSFSDVLVVPLADGETSGAVVLNLGNGNGSSSFADYAGNEDGAADLRYTTDSLANYADSGGYVTINLPSDNDLDETFTVVNATGGLGAVTLTLRREAAYDYKLVGWVNIATGEYYDVSEGPATAKINLENENVFYADWIGADYSQYRNSTDGALRTDVVDTSSFVTIEMFDYNELFNLYSASVVQSGTDSESWSDSGTLHSTLLGKGSGNTKITSSFVFTNDGTLSKAGALGYLSNRTSANTWTGTPKDTSKRYVVDSREAWSITGPDSNLFDLLFSSENANDVVGVNYVGEANYLFWIDENGYYTYDSEESAAVYDQGNKRFYVYNSPQNITRGTGSNVKQVSSFLPYNSYSSDESTYSVYNGTVDYWFGMKMTVDFYLPSATGTEGGNQLNEEDMVFYFSGDDDIWIFVDDELVLDMSGIHDRSYGSIDFSTGKVTIGMSRGDDGTIDTTYGSRSEINLKSGNHTMTVYYMERGGWESNLEIQFNMVPLWEYETGPVQTVTAEKTWLDSQGNEIDPDGLPNDYRTVGVEVGLFDVLGPATGSTFGYTESDGTYTVKYTDDSGVARTYVYVYDSSGSSLKYTENTGDGTAGTSRKYDAGSDGVIIDENGYVIAWLDGDQLHLRMDMQTLNSANDWYYAWELLDAEGEYEVLELSSGSAYTTTSENENLTSYLYWSVIGDKEIENVENSMLDGKHPVILTEAAQEAETTLGDTQEALGYVIVANVTGEGDEQQMEVATERVKFSQIATLKEVKNENTEIVTSYLGTYGVTSQSEIDALGDRALWYMVDSGHEDDDASGGTVEGFYLHCELNGTQYYLALGSDDHSLVLTLSKAAESEFFYDSLGELMIALADGNPVRVEILEDGKISIGLGEEVAAKDDVRIYTLQDTETSGFTFTAENTFLPDITIQKVDSVTGDPLSGVSFTLQNEEGEYYAKLSTGTSGDSAYEVVWVPENEDKSVPEGALQVTNGDGTIVFRYIPDGTYILTEVSTQEGYNSLPAGVKINVKDGKIQSETIGDEESGETKTVDAISWADNEITADVDEFVAVYEDGITITVKNIPGSELPSTGGVGTAVFATVGVVLVAAAGAAITVRSKKRVKGG